MNNKNKLILFFSIHLLILPNAFAGTRVVKGLYAAFGDSITAGAISMTPAPHTTNRSSDQAPSATSRKIDIVQDIIYPFVESRYENSWATGFKINSYYRRLQLLGKYQVPQISWTPLNVARTNKDFSDLDYQFEKFKKSFLQQKPQLVHITLFMGANDICHTKDPVGQFNTSPLEQNYLSFLKNIDELTEGVETEVVVVNLLRIPDLGETRFKQAKIFVGLTCDQVRNTTHTCSHMISWQNEFEKILAQSDIDSINQMLRSAKNLNLKNVKIRMADGIQNNRFEVSDMATDCFHPGKLGQQNIADKVWQSVEL